MKKKIRVYKYKFPPTIPPKMKRRGYDVYNPDSSWFCSKCGRRTPMKHAKDCPKRGVKKGFDGERW